MIKIKSFIVIAVLRRNMLRVYRVHFRVIATLTPFEEMSQHGKALLTLYTI